MSILQTACEGSYGTGGNQRIKDKVIYRVRQVKIPPKEPEIPNVPQAADEVKDKTYAMLLSMLPLARPHEENLLKRGFTMGQIKENGYKSTPVFGFRKLTERLLESGCTVEGVPGF